MNLFNIERIFPVNPLLRQLVNYFWVIDCDQWIADDLSFPDENELGFVLGFPQAGSIDNDCSLGFSAMAQEFLRNQFKEIDLHSLSDLPDLRPTNFDTGKSYKLGISFSLLGLFPFCEKPVFEFIDQPIESNLKVFSSKLCVEGSLAGSCFCHRQLDVIENLFLRLINPCLIPDLEIFDLVSAFSCCPPELSIKDFCFQLGINQRKLERVFNKYIGISPIHFKRLGRFQKALNQLMDDNKSDIVTIANENGYYDQAHFTKDFVYFSGNSPGQFQKAAVSR